MAELFGFRFERIKDSKGSEKFTTPTSDDGTIDVAGGGFFGQILDTDGRERTENDLIRRYRDISQQPECDSAIEDIINEGIVANEKDQAVAITLDNLQYPNSIKKKTEGLTVFNEMIDLANSIKSNFDMGLFDENLNKVDAQTLEYLREEVSQTDMGYGTWRRNK